MLITRIAKLIFLSFILQGCKTNKIHTDSNYQNLPIQQGFLDNDTFHKFNKKYYPMQRAIKGTEGCATIEYVVSNEPSIIEINVIASSHRDFSKTSKHAIKYWSWDLIPEGSIENIIKARNTFYFCIDDSQTIKKCPIKQFENICPNSDRIDMISSRIRR